MNRPPFVALLVLALSSLTGRADDWPQWRGPTRDGIWREKGIIETFPSEGLKILWRVEAGWGWSSPVVAGGRAYLFDSEVKAPKATERLRCFDAANGKVLWTYAYDVKYPDWAFNAEQNGGPVSTPAVVSGRIYVQGTSGETICLDAVTGDLLWRTDLGKRYDVETFRGGRTSPLIDGELVIFVIGGKPDACVVALDRNTGQERWKALHEPPANSTPAIVGAGKTRQLIVWTDQSVTSLDPATGAVHWREAMTTSNNDDNATPVWSGDRLLVSGLMFRLDAEKPGATIAWPENRAVSKRILSNTSTPWLSGEFIYSVTSKGEFVCLDAATGVRRWATEKVTAKKTGPSVHITPHWDAAFLFTDEGDLVRARLSPEGYDELSRTHLIDATYLFGGHKLVWAPPAYANRCIFVRNEKELICASLAAE